MKTIKSLVNNSKSSFYKIARSAQIVDIAQKYFNEKYSGIANYLNVVSYNKEILSISVQSSSFKSDIKINEKTHIQNINNLIAPDSINKIRCLASNGGLL